MSLRDWFAGMAMNSFIASWLKEMGDAEEKTGVERAQGCAVMAYYYADAMLAARTSENDPVEQPPGE